MSIALAVVGAAGRTAGRVVAAVARAEDCVLVAALESPDSGVLGRDAGELVGAGRLDVPVTAELAVPIDGLIDFSTPHATRTWVREALERRVPLVSGTTGLSAQDQALLSEAAGSIPVLWTPNTSLGVNLLLALVSRAARVLGPDWDVEIVETHHRGKRDAPSGTALSLRDAVAEVRGDEPPTVCGREGRAASREGGEVGVHSVRLGGDPGAHAVHLGGPHETLTLAHRAHSRDAYALGALAAMRWLVGREPGLYGMADVLR